MKSLEVLIRLHRFQMEEKQRMIEQIEELITDTEEKAEVLAQQVMREQEKTGIEDTAHFAFPMYAKAAQLRRENLLNTSADLKEQVADARLELSDAYAQVKKFEALKIAREESIRKQIQQVHQNNADETAAINAEFDSISAEESDDESESEAKSG